MNYRSLTPDEIRQLRQQGCTAENWQQVLVKTDFDPQYVEDAHFSGDVRIGVFRRMVEMPGGVHIHSGIRHAVIHHCIIEDDCHIYDFDGNPIAYIDRESVWNYVLRNGPMILAMNFMNISWRMDFIILHRITNGKRQLSVFRLQEWNNIRFPLKRNFN